MLTKEMKKGLSKIFNQGQPEPVYPLREGTRTLWVDNGTKVEYGFLEVDDENDYEIEQWLLDNLAIYITAPYDCSGQFFTRRIHWKHNPDGSVSFVHYMGLDV